jgi:hypothetical protein
VPARAIAEDLTSEVFLQMIGKKPNAVKTLQFRALQSLQRILGKQRWPTCVQQGHKEEIR